MDDEADDMLEESLWEVPTVNGEGKSLFVRHLGIITKLIHARKRYKFFYDCRSIQMIASYVNGYFFGGEM